MANVAISIHFFNTGIPLDNLGEPLMYKHTHTHTLTRVQPLNGPQDEEHSRVQVK